MTDAHEPLGSDDLSLLYRGPLSSCNYGCPYCPFAKRAETHAALAGDRAALGRFLDWCATQTAHRLGVLFTPWGEALVRPWYREALTRLTHLPRVRRAAAQTNLSCPLDWLADCDTAKLGLWATYHPGEVERGRFLRQCLAVYRSGASLSVGVVGLREHHADAAALRAELPPEVYLWVNAYKREVGYYSPDDLAAWRAIDPLFDLNAVRHPSRGRPCWAGERALSVAGDGTLRRCHFVADPIGNLYDDSFPACLWPRPCPNDTCGCHLGYVHLKPLKLYDVYGAGLLERVAHPTARRMPSSNATAGL